MHDKRVGQTQTLRVAVDGRHLRVGADAHRVRGATYGSFQHRLDGSPFPERSQIKRDLDDMARAGLNTVRTYELPPQDLLDAAREFDVRVLAGLHYHDWRMETRPGRAALRRIRYTGLMAIPSAMERLAGAPSVLPVWIGNEVPADLVRVHGVHAVQDTLSEFAAEVHRLDS